MQEGGTGDTAIVHGAKSIVRHNEDFGSNSPSVE
jgi:hypothetical protein